MSREIRAMTMDEVADAFQIPGAFADRVPRMSTVKIDGKRRVIVGLLREGDGTVVLRTVAYDDPRLPPFKPARGGGRSI